MTEFSMVTQMGNHISRGQPHPHLNGAGTKRPSKIFGPPIYA